MPCIVRLDGNFVLKISDFGLTRKNDQEYGNNVDKSKEDDRATPVRWMSIEAIEFREFTMKSDVVCMM